MKLTKQDRKGIEPGTLNSLSAPIFIHYPCQRLLHLLKNSVIFEVGGCRNSRRICSVSLFTSPTLCLGLYHIFKMLCVCYWVGKLHSGESGRHLKDEEKVAAAGGE